MASSNDARTARIDRRIAQRKPDVTARSFDRWERQLLSSYTFTVKMFSQDRRHERLMREAGQAADH
jgi:hypothetical protein